MRTIKTVTCLLLLVPILSGGCIGKGTVKPTKMYIFHAMRSPQQAETHVKTNNAVIGIERMELAGYLKRPHIITRVDGNEIHLADFARWAEPLEDGIPKVLAENLSLLLGTEKVLTAPWKGFVNVDYHVFINVIQLDARFDGEAVLAVRWGVAEGNVKESPFFMKISTYRKPLSGSSYNAVVAAENSLLEDLSRDVAAEIAGMAAK